MSDISYQTRKREIIIIFQMKANLHQCKDDTFKTGGKNYYNYYWLVTLKKE